MYWPQNTKSVTSSKVPKGSSRWCKQWNATKLNRLEHTSTVLNVGEMEREGKTREAFTWHGPLDDTGSKVSRYMAHFFFHPFPFFSFCEVTAWMTGCTAPRFLFLCSTTGSAGGAWLRWRLHQIFLSRFWRPLISWRGDAHSFRAITAFAFFSFLAFPSDTRMPRQASAEVVTAKVRLSGTVRVRRFTSNGFFFALSLWKAKHTQREFGSTEFIFTVVYCILFQICALLFPFST